MTDLEIATVPQLDNRLGRQMVHDARSRAFAAGIAIDRSTWRDKMIRLYDPFPNPNQRVGCCTGVAKCSQLNALGNRKVGRVLNMSNAENIYARNTQIDPWDGTWPPDDTGSSGLASAKTAAEFGLAKPRYEWLFGGADEVVQSLMMGRVISVGTWWYDGMFRLDSQGRVRLEGPKMGGHQYVIRGYDLDRDEVMGRCWWGTFRDFWMKREHLDYLLRDGGDAHWQETV